MKTHFTFTALLVALALGCERHDKHEHAAAVDDCCAPAMAAVAGIAKQVNEVTLSTNAIKENGVVLGNVTRRKLMPTFTAPARVAFDEETMAHVSSPVSGRVVSLSAHLGDRVEANQTLFIIDSTELGAAQNEYLKQISLLVVAQSGQTVAQLDPELAQREADHAKALAQQVLAENNSSIVQAQATLAAARLEVATTREIYESGKKLLESAGGIATAEVLRRETAWRTAEIKETAARAVLQAAHAQWQQDQKYAQASLLAAQAVVRAGEARKAKVLKDAQTQVQQVEFAIAGARNHLQLLGMDAAALAMLENTRQLRAQCSVRASRAGTVVESEITAGEMASPDRPHLMILADLSLVWVLVDVPHARALMLKAGQTVMVSDPASRRTVQSTVAHVSPTADPETRTVQVRAVLDNRDGHWRPGTFVTAQLPEANEPQESLVIPREAVQMIGGQPVVFVPVPGAENKFARREVKLGREVDGWLPVLSGLQPEEVVVAQGSFILKAQLLKASAEHEHDHSDGF
ncbi:MAG: HlyD family efflux transporter periplasmic adaptor subunit [Pedosphaera sp.]|nr:HlyD family efflux transporter periplasmic adaptor subunit [Pedosphaera sp.]